MLSSYELSVLAIMGLHILMALSVYVPMATGQVSLGNAGFMAIGGYVAGVFTVNFHVPLMLALAVGGLVAGIIGLVFAYPALRLRGFYLVMATLGFGEIVRVFFMNFQYTGGVRGFKGLYGATTGLIWFWVVLFLGFLWTIFRSRIGLSFSAVNEDDLAAECMGLNLTRYKVAAFGLGGFIAGVAGGLYGHYFFFINPDTFNFWTSVNAVLFVILGGMEIFWGAALGAILFTFLQEALRFAQEWRMLVFGAILVVAIIFRPSGLLTRVLLRGSPRMKDPSGKNGEHVPGVLLRPWACERAIRSSASEAAPILRALQVSKDFGGVRALHEVSLEVHEGTICGLIGPNGAGKTTFFNLITNTLAASGGEIVYRGHPLARLAPHAIAALGVARTFQSVHLIGSLTVLENVLLGQNLRIPILRAGLLPLTTRNERRLRREAMEILQFLGLEGRRDMKPSVLPYADQRRLEIARALATSPSLLLLDEPAAGMNPKESEELMIQLQKIREMGKTILIIEHDMKVIMSLCDYICVLNFGEKIAEGRPQEVQGNARVLEAYLGAGV